MRTVEDRVRAGMEFLGKAYPGWLARIDLDELRVGSAGTCPLAQASGKSYGTAMKEQKLSIGDTVNLGFQCRFTWFWEFPPLTAEWRRQIATEQNMIEKVSEILHV